VSVEIGGSNAEILYAGAAPGMVSGILQVTCRVPARVGTGVSAPLLLRIGDTTSPPVTISVRNTRLQPRPRPLNKSSTRRSSSPPQS
jgi:uncharacterized protein (TIGR03437 family)